MKKMKYLVATNSLLFIIVCEKANAIIFDDKSVALIVSKEDWTMPVSNFSPNEAPKATTEKLTNNESKTYWHTNYAIVTPHPQWILIDMKNEVKMISVGIANRYAANRNTVGIKKFKIEGSCDGTTFTSLGEFNFAIAHDLQNFPVLSTTTYRYLKVTALETQRLGSNHTCLSEIDIFGAKQTIY